MFRKHKDRKARKIGGSTLDNQAGATSEKLKGFNRPATWDLDALTEAEQAAAKSNAERGDDTDHLLKVTGLMWAGPHPRFSDD